MLKYYGEQIDAIGITDDYGGQQNMLLSPDSWRRFFKPHLTRLFSQVRAAGKYLYYHSCGYIVPIIPDLVDMGVNILHPIQPESIDIFSLKKCFGKDLTFAGGISSQKTVPFGTPEEIRKEVMECIEIMGKFGGYILAPGKPIFKEVPIKNAITLIETIIKQK